MERMLWKRISTLSNYVKGETRRILMCGVMDQHYQEIYWIWNEYGMECILEDRYEGKTVKISNKKIPTELIYIVHHQSSLQTVPQNLILVETNLSFEGPRIMFKDIRMQNNGEVCQVVVISSHVPVKQENVHDFCCPFINNSFVRLGEIGKSMKISRLQNFVSWMYELARLAL